MQQQPNNRKMAARHVEKKLLHCNSEAGRFQKPEQKPPARFTVPGPSNKHSIDMFAKEEQYKIINAELEAKTADIVRQAEQLMREQNEVLSKPIPTQVVYDNEDDSRTAILRQPVMQNPGRKETTPKEFTSRPVSQKRHSRNKSKNKEKSASYNTVTPTLSLDDNEAVQHFSLAKTLHSLEDKLEDPGYKMVVADEASNIQDNIGSDAQIRVLKAKLRVMQEELDHLSHQHSKKDDENGKLCTKIKEVEDERARLQKHTNIQQAQIEKQRALAEESSKKCDGLQLQVASLQKEIESLNRAQKQAAGQQSSVELRLNRALDEVERLKSILSKTKQMSKDKMNEDHQNKENLLAENKMLKKQKAELITGFKKQLKLIDILKRQKMHFEAAKMLSFTEEEFMTALDWGKS